MGQLYLNSLYILISSQQSEAIPFWVIQYEAQCKHCSQLGDIQEPGALCISLCVLLCIHYIIALD